MGLLDFFRKKPKSGIKNVQSSVSQIIRSKQNGGTSDNQRNSGGAAGAAGMRLSAQKKAREAQYERLKSRQPASPVFHAVNNAAKASRESKSTAAAALNDIRRTTNTKSNSNYLQKAYELSKTAGLEKATDRATTSTNAARVMANGLDLTGNGRSMVQRDNAQTAKVLTKNSDYYRRMVNAGLQNKGVLNPGNTTPTEEELEYRKKYGFDKRAADYWNNLANSDREVTLLHGQEQHTPARGSIYRAPTEDVTMNPDAFWLGHEEAYMGQKPENMMREQYGVELDEDALNEKRSTGSYGLGLMTGQGEQFALTSLAAGPLAEVIGGARNVEKASQAVKVLKSLKGAKTPAANFMAQEILSAPVNFFAAMKEDDLKDKVKAFVIYQGLDAVFAGAMQIPAIRNNPKLVRAFLKNQEANSAASPAAQRALREEAYNILDSMSPKSRREAAELIARADYLDRGVKAGRNENYLFRRPDAINEDATGMYSRYRAGDADYYAGARDELIDWNMQADRIPSRQEIAQNVNRFTPGEAYTGVQGGRFNGAQINRSGASPSDLREVTGRVPTSFRPEADTDAMARRSFIGEHEAATGNSGHVLLDDNQRIVLAESGVPSARMTPANRRSFSDALSLAKQANSHGGYVDGKSPLDLQNAGAKSFLADDGMSGFSITGDGDIVAVFRNPASKKRGVVREAILTARANGGTKMDCYGIDLVNRYESAGYIPVAKVRFNPEFVDDPVLLREQPDVYFMMKNTDSLDDAVRKSAWGQYHLSSQEELDALPVFDDVIGPDGKVIYGYDRAMDYRNTRLAAQEAGEPSPESLAAIRNDNVDERAAMMARTEPAQVEPGEVQRWVAEYNRALDAGATEEEAKITADTLIYKDRIHLRRYNEWSPAEESTARAFENGSREADIASGAGEPRYQEGAIGNTPEYREELAQLEDRDLTNLGKQKVAAEKARSRVAEEPPEPEPMSEATIDGVELSESERDVFIRTLDDEYARTGDVDAAEEAAENAIRAMREGGESEEARAARLREEYEFAPSPENLRSVEESAPEFPPTPREMREARAENPPKAKSESKAKTEPKAEPEEPRVDAKAEAMFDDLEDINYQPSATNESAKTEPYLAPRVVSEDAADVKKYAAEGARYERMNSKLGKEHGTWGNNVPKKNAKGQQMSKAEASSRTAQTVDEQYEGARQTVAGASGTKNSQSVKDVKATVEERWKANPEGQRKLLEQELADMRDAKLHGRIYHPKHFESTQEMMESVEEGLKRGRKAAEEAKKAGNYELEADYIAQNYQLHELRVNAVSEAGAIMRQYQEYIKASPEAMRTLIQREVDDITERYAKQLEKHGIKEIKIREDLLERIRNAENPEDAAAAMKELSLDIWNQVPASLKEKLDTWRMTSMLMNPRTHARNIAGNAFFKPFYSISDRLTYLGERHLIKTGKLNKSEATRAILDRSNKDDIALIKAGEKYFNDNMDILRGENKYYEDFGGIRRRPMEGIEIKNPDGTTTKIKAKIFTAGKDDPNALARGIDKAHELNASALDKEDIYFMRKRFSDMYAQRMKARGLTPETATKEEIDDIVEGALNDALKSVYRDSNKAAEIVNKWRRVNPNDSMWRKGAAWAVDTTMPFVKTPINILRRSWEYSPAGLFQGIARVNSALKSGDAKAITGALNELTAGMTGTSVAVLGAFLASTGTISGKIEENDKGWYEKDLGKQNYALRLGSEENGYTYTLDWAAPMSIPLFTGVTMYNAAKDMIDSGRMDVGTLLEAIGETFDPTMEMSVLQGLSNAFQAISSGDSAGDAVVDLGLTTALNYLSQFNPTINGQVARTIDPTRRDTSSTADSQVSRSIQKWWNKQIAKTPMLSKTLQPYRNVWGQEDTTNAAFAAIENFISPGYASRLKYDIVDHEINRINEGVSEQDQVFPSKFMGRDITYHEEKLHLSAADRNYIQMVQGQSQLERAQNLINSDEYRKASNAEKRKMMKSELSAAETDAKQRYLIDKKGYDAWDVYLDGASKGKVEQSKPAKDAGMDALEYKQYVDYDVDAYYGDGNGRISQDEAKAYLDTLDIPNSQKSILWKAYNAGWSDKNNPYGSGYVGSGSGGGKSSKSGGGSGRSGSGKTGSSKGGSSRSGSSKSSSKKSSTPTAENIKFSDFSKYNLNFANMSKSNRTALIKLIQQTSKKA